MTGVQNNRQQARVRGATRCHLHDGLPDIGWGNRITPRCQRTTNRGERGQTDGPKEVPRGARCRSRSTKKPSERRTLIFASYQKSVTLAEGYVFCMSKAPSAAPISSTQTGQEGPSNEAKNRVQEILPAISANDNRTALTSKSIIPLQPRGRTSKHGLATRRGREERRVFTRAAHCFARK